MIVVNRYKTVQRFSQAMLYVLVKFWVSPRLRGRGDTLSWMTSISHLTRHHCCTFSVSFLQRPASLRHIGASESADASASPSPSPSPSSKVTCKNMNVGTQTKMVSVSHYLLKCHNTQLYFDI